jgi:hypothetical protein
MAIGPAGAEAAGGRAVVDDGADGGTDGSTAAAGVAAKVNIRFRRL